jgi:hypothetical protein
VGEDLQHARADAEKLTERREVRDGLRRGEQAAGIPDDRRLWDRLT